jgi:hypothetical protein
MELDGRATRARVERIDVRAGAVVWRRCSRVAFIGRGMTEGGRSRSNRRRLGGASMTKPFRVVRKWGGETGSRGRGTAAPIHFAAGEEGSSGRRERAGEVVAAAPGRTSGGRRRSGSLTGWAHLSVSEGKASGRLGRKGREEVGHGWAGKGGRRWAAAGLEKEGGGRAESIARAEIQNSKRKSILIDF